MHAIDPLGVNVATTDGLNLIHYYDCLRQPGGFPYCSGFTQPPSFYTPHNASGGSASSSFSVKVDGALSILSVGDIMGILQRQGIQASVVISPALNGTPLTQGMAGSFVRKTTSGWVEKPGHFTSKGKYESDWKEVLYDTWDFVPGGEPEPQQQGGGRKSESENLETAEGIKRESCVVTLVARKINFKDTVLGRFDSSLNFYHLFVTTGPKKDEWEQLYHGWPSDGQLVTTSLRWDTPTTNRQNWDREDWEKYGGFTAPETVPRSCDTIKSNFDDTLNSINKANIKYNMTKGPNSNSAVATMLFDFDRGLQNRLWRQLNRRMGWDPVYVLTGMPRIPAWGVVKH